MSTVLVLTPIVIANWSAIAAAVSTIAAQQQFAIAKAEAQQKVRARRLLRELGKQGAKQADATSTTQSPPLLGQTEGRAEIELPESEILPTAPGVAETMTIERDGVRATFSRDERGALKLCLEGPHLSKAQLLAIGEDLMGRVTQQYVYHRIVSELKERQVAIVGEEVSPDRSVKIRVRNF
jgi:hypothetical protein